jgi:hypothetical protein
MQMEHKAMVETGILTEAEFWASKSSLLESLAMSSRGGTEARGDSKGKKIGLANQMVDMNVSK